MSAATGHGSPQTWCLGCGGSCCALKARAGGLSGTGPIIRPGYRCCVRRSVVLIRTELYGYYDR